MAQPAIDPLPSWNDGPAKDAILDFVRRVTMDDSSDFVPVHERVAVFDNDGTLWCEMPVPVQAYFAADRIKALLPEHPEWRITEPFKSQLAGDVKGVMAQGIKGVAEIAMATHAGMTTDEFDTIDLRCEHGYAYADLFTGYANLVIIEHADKSYSLYGHLSSLSVKKGDRVDAGTTVGLAGRNPAGNPSLYFELRIDGKPVDPLQWLKR